MPLYFIHVTSADDTYEDVEGVELADDAAAHEFAIRDARYLMDEGFIEPSQWPAWRVEVVSESGRRRLALTFDEIQAQRRSPH